MPEAEGPTKTEKPANLANLPAQVEQTEQEEGARNFLVFLRELANGAAVNELSYQLHKLTTTMQEEACAQQKEVRGGLTLQINVVADEQNQAEIGFTVAIKVPSRKTPRSLMFLTKGGNLTIKNPRQQELPLRQVPGGRQRPRDITVPKNADADGDDQDQD